jgi:hypothetical protein
MGKLVTSSSKRQDRRDVWNARLLRGCHFDGKYEMPMLPLCETVPKALTAVSDANIGKADGSFLHSFEDDYKFEKLWREPRRYLALVQSYGGAIAPDFSVYRSMPLAEQLNSVYRSRAIGCWWAKNGVVVVPNVRWGDKRTFEFCFGGLPQNSVVAVGTHGCVKRIRDKSPFFEGFLVMLERIHPSTVIVYGANNDDIFPPLFVYGYGVRIISFQSKFSCSHVREVV